MTYFTDPIHEWGLIKHIHWSSFKEGAGPFDFDVGFVHLQAGFLNHFHAMADIASKRDKSAVCPRCIVCIAHACM